jgi:hypothetical protein
MKNLTQQLESSNKQYQPRKFDTTYKMMSNETKTRSFFFNFLMKNFVDFDMVEFKSEIKNFDYEWLIDIDFDSVFNELV